MVVSQREYILDLPEEIGMIGRKPTKTPIDPISTLELTIEGNFVEKGIYQGLMGNLIQLSHTRSDVAYKCCKPIHALSIEKYHGSSSRKLKVFKGYS